MRDMQWVAQSAKAGLRSVADLIWPARSLITGMPSGGQGGLSAKELTQITFLTGGCRSCAHPLSVEYGRDTRCAACDVEPPNWTQARSAIAYDDVSSRLVLDLKHGGRRDGLPIYANWMALTGEEILEETDWLVPVPLHYQRLASRGFNQAVWLAQAVGRKSRTLTLVDGLIRTRSTETQNGKSMRQRHQNVAGAFTVRQSRAKRINGARITLVDDVLTTGATASACAKALLRAGAETVHVLTLARVVREADVTI